MQWLKRNWYTIAIPLVAILIGGSIAVATKIQQRPIAESVKTEQTLTTPTHQENKYEDDGIDANEILELVNAERIRVGVSPLSMDLRLVRSAQQKADDMAHNDYNNHVNPVTGKHGYEYAHEAIPSCSGVSENIQLNDTSFITEISSQGTFNGWKLSPPHYKAMIDPRYTLTGVATATSGTKTYIVEHFCQP